MNAFWKHLNLFKSKEIANETPNNEILTKTGFGVKKISYKAVRKNIKKIMTLNKRKD